MTRGLIEAGVIFVAFISKKYKNYKNYKKYKNYKNYIKINIYISKQKKNTQN